MREYEVEVTLTYRRKVKHSEVLHAEDAADAEARDMLSQAGIDDYDEVQTHTEEPVGVRAAIGTLEPHGDDDLARMEIIEADSGETLFWITAEQGSGDYRGFPACVFVVPLTETFPAFVSRVEADPDLGYPGMDADGGSFKDWVENVWNMDDGEGEREFLLSRDADREADDPYGWEFVEWCDED